MIDAHTLPGYPAVWGGSVHPDSAYPGPIYRYTLWRTWESDLFRDEGSLRYLMVVGLNPSTADIQKNDPTVKRCAGRARRMGFDAFVMTNLFAYRATSPADMKRQADPVGPDNDAWLGRLAEDAALVLVAWGTHGNHLDRARQVLPLLGPKVHCLAVNDDGTPKHPLYVATEQELQRYTSPSGST